MINRRHHERRQLGDMIWYDLEERRVNDDRRAEQEREAAKSLKFKAFIARWSFHISIIVTVLFYTILIIEII